MDSFSHARRPCESHLPGMGRTAPRDVSEEGLFLAPFAAKGHVTDVQLLAPS